VSARAAVLPFRRSGLWLDAWRRFTRDRLALAGGIVLAVLAFAAAGAPLLTRYAPNEVDLKQLDAAPSASHWFGTSSAARCTRAASRSRSGSPSRSRRPPPARWSARWPDTTAGSRTPR
jgi:hypothetical protein